MTKIKAKYANGVLIPLEPLNLEEGAVVELDIGVVAPSPPLPERTADESKFQVIPRQSTVVDKYQNMLPSHIDEELFIEEYLEKERKIRNRGQ